MHAGNAFKATRAGSMTLGNEIGAHVMSAGARADSPLSDPDNLDLIGERNDGGVDMLVVTTGPLDESDATCARLRDKLHAYLYAATHSNLANVYPAARHGRVRIFLSDSHAISQRARVLIEQFSAEALARNVEVKIGDPLA